MILYTWWASQQDLVKNNPPFNFLWESISTIHPPNHQILHHQHYLQSKQDQHPTPKWFCQMNKPQKHFFSQLYYFFKSNCIHLIQFWGVNEKPPKVIRYFPSVVPNESCWNYCVNPLCSDYFYLLHRWWNMLAFIFHCDINCRVWRSSWHGCYCFKTGAHIAWSKTLRPLGRNPSCICLAVVSQNPGMSPSQPQFVFLHIFTRSSFSFFFQTSLDVTETFKQQKGKLVQEGFNPEITKDHLYFLDITQKDYLLLNVSLYEDIVNGKIKL